MTDIKEDLFLCFINFLIKVDLADVQLISKTDKEFRFLLCVIHSISIVDASQKILDKSGCKSNKIWVDEGSEFYNNSFKK